MVGVELDVDGGESDVGGESDSWATAVRLMPQTASKTDAERHTKPRGLKRSNIRVFPFQKTRRHDVVCLFGASASTSRFDL
jgi:hypothetical protein